MKKTLLITALLATSGAFAQTIVNFEDLTLAPNSYWDGSDSTLQFVSGGITFPNEYDFQYGYWSGSFVYSNMADDSTAGFTNPFSAYPATGSGGSGIYAVNYQGNLDLNSEKVLSSIDITNTTYAALSMMYGDSYGKVFGSPLNAQDEPDGTNGEDFFRLLISGYNSNHDSLGTVVFYLADFRFEDSTQDYIVDSWQTVDLSSLGAVRYLDFKLESSDVGQYGMNTPAYFALDNLVYGNLAVEENTILAFEMYPNPAQTSFIVKGNAGKITVTSISGTVVYEGSSEGMTTISCDQWANGTYIVSCSNGKGIYRSVLTKQ